MRMPTFADPKLSLRRLRFMTCGSVDDGKSTLIGRLLYDAGAVYEDHLAEALQAARSEVLDLSFLVDGLKAEREQGITIEVAYRYFMTPRRSFLIADAPGHEQYTRNQAAAASQTDLAIVVISATDGVRRQTRRHMAVAAMFGVRDIIVVINKMDSVGWDRVVFDALASEAAALAGRLGQRIVGCLPISARFGANVTTTAAEAPWYNEPPLIDLLERFEPIAPAKAPFVLPIQGVARLDGGGRLVLGEIADGCVELDQELLTHDGLEVSVKGLWRSGVAVKHAAVGDAVALQLTPERDLARGAVLMSMDSGVRCARQLKVRMIALDEALKSGRSYEIALGASVGVAVLARVEGIENLATGAIEAVERNLEPNDILIGRLTLSGSPPCAPFSISKALGAFILVDRASCRTVAAGVVLSVEQSNADVPEQQVAVTPTDRANMLAQSPLVYWLTGLSGSGKSTIADALDAKLHALGRHTAVLDGDNLRRGLNSDLGFSDADRIENSRRVAHVAAMMADAGLIVIVSLISPFAAERARAREVIGPHRFIEVFVDAPLEVCAMRDPKGHYRRAADGHLRQLTGISSTFEPPASPDVHLRTDRISPQQAIAHLLEVTADLGGWR